MKKSDKVKIKKNRKKAKWWQVLLNVVVAIAALYLILFVINVCCNLSLRKYIDSFDPVEYGADRLVPEKQGEYYCITTDRDVKIMHFTDIHIGGGIGSYKNDKKSITELITMLRAEKPDIVILGGDNTYCLPVVGFYGGNTFNNKMTHKTVLEIFEHEQVYFTTVFGNHDTEAVDYADRDEVGELYMSDEYKYCFFEQNFSDRDAETVPSVSNQIVLLKNNDGSTRKVLLLVDSNAYVDTSIISIIKGTYDVIHDAQVDWARDAITELSKQEGLPSGEYLKCFSFMHIPFGEYKNAMDDLITETRDENGVASFSKGLAKNTVYIEGAWGEERVCYGGLSNEGTPESQDKFFEVLADEMHSLEASFCGHDHSNNAVVEYKGVMLDYGYSVDNEAYGPNYKYSGEQRGATVITVSKDGSFTEQHKNAYTDYGCSTTEFGEIKLDEHFYPQWFRKPDELN